LNLTKNNEPYINAEGHKVLEYISSDSIILDLPFIKTTGKRLTKGMPYLLLEKKVDGHDTSAIRLLNYQDYQGVIYLSVQNLKTNRCYNLCWNMEIDGEGMWFWSLADFETLTT
jgi:hypothetical protein